MPWILLIACYEEPLPTDPVSLPEKPGPVEVEPPPQNPDRPPVVKGASISPASPTVLDELVATVEASDPEGATLRYFFEWFVGDRPLLGRTTDTLRDGFARGDHVKFKVRVRDAEGAEDFFESSPITIQNAPPVIDTEPATIRKLDGTVIAAHDPDEDRCTWKLADAPVGMTISAEGKIAYQGSVDEKGGHYDVKITCDDGNGGWGTIQLPLDISPGSAAKRKMEEEEKTKAR